MDRLLSYIVRLIVWLSGFVKPLSRLGLCRYDEWSEGKKLKILLTGYNGARNTGADARVVALVKQLEEALGNDNVELTVMTLDNENVKGYFPSHVHQWTFTTMFFWSLLRATSQHHVAILCEGSTLTTTFAKALSVFYCQVAGIMQRQGKPCIAYGSEIGHLDGWLAKLSRDLCHDTYFIVRTEDSLKNLKALGLKGHVGTDTAWPFQTTEGENWARNQLMADGWDGKKPLLGVAVVNPFWWPVRPSISRWAKAVLTGHRERQYDKFYFFSDSKERREKFQRYLSEIAQATNRYQKEHDAFVVILGMEKLDEEACKQFSKLVEGPHQVYHSKNHNVFQMTGLLRQLSMLVTSRYHAAVLSMEQAIPIVAVSMDGRLDGVIEEAELADHYLHHVEDADLGERITTSLQLADCHRKEISDTIKKHQVLNENRVKEMSQFFTAWLKEQFS
ncbi:MAG: polysaccharide pyruvyl transferase family protein [Bacteroidaceae bacterium]|nr:polysaccharide pyruvyl transferase family protein [Bacteroidaceae bacterium]